METCAPKPASPMYEKCCRATATILRVLGSPAVAYLSLALLQIVALRGYWTTKDVTTGDTASYFLTAIRWPESFQVNIAWSPLYTSYMGTFYGLTDDPVRAILLHRLVIVFAASLLTLAVLRRLLPHGWAWLAAAWWTVLPINYDTLYEVHLFAVLPLLTIWLLLSFNSKWAHGAALAVLGASVFLVRNEMCIAFALMAMYFLIRESIAWFRSNHRSAGQLFRTTAAYGIPLAMAVVVCCFAYSRSTVKYPVLSKAMRAKHTLNMAQVYSFGYGQRHPDWKKSPWVEYQDLMTEHFGEELPSLRQMIAYNPGAVAEHFAWNLGLTWNGIQVLLFNATTGSVNPDYAPVKLNRMWVWVPSILMLACWAIASCLILRHRRFWWRAWFQHRRAIWIGMLAVAAVMPLVICTQRPRPSYLFGLSIMFMAWTGMCAFAIVHHLRLRRLLSKFAPLSAPIVIAIVAILPCHFKKPHRNLAPRPLATRLQQLQPFQPLYRDPATKLVQGEYAHEIRSYLGEGKCELHSYQVLRRDWPEGMSLSQFLENHNFNGLFLDENTLCWLQTERPEDAQEFLTDQAPQNWKLLKGYEIAGQRWRMYQRQSDVETTELASAEHKLKTRN